MKNNKVIALGLSNESSADVEWFRAQLDVSLLLLRDLLTAGGGPERAEIGTRLEHCRSVLAVDDRGAVARSTFSQTLSRCREVAAFARQQEQEREQEMASLFALVRDAVVSVGAEMTSLQTTVGQSADRFESIAGLQDPRQIRMRLVAEIGFLKRAAAERKKAWEATSKEFSKRVEVLEDQLVASRNEAALDALTGIANRRTFDRTCREWIRSARAGFVLAMLDVDDFKGINDTHGHAAGDQVLTAIAQALLSSVRPGDLVARLGGDEFAILATELTLRQAEGRFSRTIETLCNTPSTGGPGELPCVPKLSCGIAEFSAGDTFESLYERADEALYAAKRQGKHRVAVKARAFIRDLMAK